MMPERGTRSAVLQCRELQKIIYLTLEKEFRPLQRHVKDFSDGEILKECLRKAEEKMHEKFAEQMHLIQHATENEAEELHDYPKTEQYLSFVGVDEDVIQGMTKIRGICLMQLLEMADSEVTSVLSNFCAPADNEARLLEALKLLRKEIDKLNYPEEYANSTPSPASNAHSSRLHLTDPGVVSHVEQLTNDVNAHGSGYDGCGGHSGVGDDLLSCSLNDAGHSSSGTPGLVSSQNSLTGGATSGDSGVALHASGLNSDAEPSHGVRLSVSSATDSATHSRSQTPHTETGGRTSPPALIDSMMGREDAVGFVSEAASVGGTGSYDVPSALGAHRSRVTTLSVTDVDTSSNTLAEGNEDDEDFDDNTFIPVSRAYMGPSRSVPSTPGPMTKQPRCSASPPSSPLIRTHRGAANIHGGSSTHVPSVGNGGGLKPGTPPPNHRRIQPCPVDSYSVAPLFKSLSHESDLHNRVTAPAAGTNAVSTIPHVGTPECTQRSSGGRGKKKGGHPGELEVGSAGGGDNLSSALWSPGGSCHSQSSRRRSVDERLYAGTNHVAPGSNNCASELVASADATCGVGINSDLSLSVPHWSPKSPLSTSQAPHRMKTKSVLPWPMTAQKCVLCQKPIRGKLKQCRSCKNSWHPDCAMRAPAVCSAGLSGSRTSLGSVGGLNSGSGITQDQLNQYMRSQDGAAVDPKGSPSVCRKTSHQQPLTVPHCMLRPAQSTPTFNGSDSNSNSSCSSSPSSPFVDQQSPTPHRAGRSAVKMPDAGTASGNGAQIFDFSTQPEIRIDEPEAPPNVGTHSSNDSDKTVIESNIIRFDSVDSQDDQGHDKGQLQRDNSRALSAISVTLKEWDIPYQELKLEEAVGRGQFSTVHRGQWHGEVAIKILDMNPAEGNRERLSAFKLEVATLRKTRHDNLVLFMGACMKPPDPLAIVTSFCKGETLHQQLHHRRHRFGVNKSITIALQICQGMSYLHARGIVHKDLKTKNIFVESGHKVVISDFGLFNATRMCRATTARGDAISVPVGWLGYLAPEIIQRLSVSVSEADGPDGANINVDQQLPFSRASDVFAFGTVWYEMLTMEWPFRSQPPEAIIFLVGNGIKPPLPSVQGPKDIKEIFLRCWSFEPKDRSSFVELKAQLEKLPKLHRNPSYPVKSGSMSRSHESLV